MWDIYQTFWLSSRCAMWQGSDGVHPQERKDPSPLLVEEQFSTHKLYAERETERETQNSETKDDWVVSEYVADYLVTSAKALPPVSLSLSFQSQFLTLRLLRLHTRNIYIRFVAERVRERETEWSILWLFEVADKSMAAPPVRARADYDYLIKLLLIGDSGLFLFAFFFFFFLVGLKNGGNEHVESKSCELFDLLFYFILVVFLYYGCISVFYLVCERMGMWSRMLFDCF